MIPFIVLLLLYLSFGLTPNIGKAQHDFYKQFEGIFHSIHDQGLSVSNGVGVGSMNGPFIQIGGGYNQLPSGFSLLTADLIAKDFLDEVRISIV